MCCGNDAVAGVHLVESESDGVLVPQPSDSPEDPLNWSPMWKGVVMASMFMTAFLQAFGPLAIAPQVPHYMAEWNRSVPDVLRFVAPPSPRLLPLVPRADVSRPALVS